MLNKLSKSVAISLIFCFLFVDGNAFLKKYDEEEGKEYLKMINNDIQVKTTESVLASWAYESNITDENLSHQLDVSAKLANYTKEIWKETIKYPWKTFKDPDIRRQFQKFSVLGTAILSPPKYERFNKIISEMQSTYGKAKICNYHNRTDCSMQLEPELTEVFVKSRDPDELRYYWEQWRNAAGKPVRKMYKEYVDLSNEAAVLNNFTDNTEFWLKDYEAKDFKQQVEALWEQLRPLYLQLHAYVRRRLREQYGEKHVTRTGPIPAHLLGNMWAQSWGNVFNITAPYPDKPNMDVTSKMVEQGYTPLRMFKLAEEFFTSLNLSPMPDTFWKNSILEKPLDGRDLICHASAWDFYDGKDFRIKQCTRITFRQLVTVHHEMGHIQYYLQYKNQPKIYRRGANPGFHEAVGDVMALSVSTPKHLRKIGLLNATQDDAESDINQLFNMALDKIAFLPFGYLMDQWRWSVFEGKTTERDYNCKWWQLREKYQGLSPSVIRTEDDFDPGAKYHTVGNVPYIRYFVSFVIQFQFHRSLCIAANEFKPNDPTSKPLYKCDIYQSKEAGALLKKMLQMGSSKPWPDAMEVMTGQRKMDASALLDYFATLQTWLENENKKTGEFIGWESSQKACNWEEGVTEEPEISDTHGNFEDESIAYSYAEFVRQDDNSFGSPDYLEEIQPSYHALGCRLKKKEIRGNYYLPKRNVLKFSKSKNLYLPKRSHSAEKNKFIDLFKPKTRGDEQLEKKTLSQRLFGNGNNKLTKLPINTDSEKRTKRQDPIKSESPNFVTRKIQKNKDDSNDDNFSPFKWVSEKEKDKDKDRKKLKKSTIKRERGLENDSKFLDSQKESGKEFYKKALLDFNKKSDDDKKYYVANDLNKYEDSKVNRNDETEIKLTEKLKNFKNKSPFCSRFNSGSGSSSSKDVNSQNLDLDDPNNMLWEAEVIKKKAQEILKNYNLFNSNLEPSFRDQNLSQWSNSIQVFSQNPSGMKKTYFEKDSEDRSQPQSSNIYIESFEDPSEALELTDLNKNGKEYNQFTEYNLVRVIPVEKLLYKRRITQKLDGEKREVNLKKGESSSNFVLLIGKLSKNPFLTSNYDDNKTKKRSYIEYHCKPRILPIYNAVVINSGTKNDKSDDAKGPWAKVSSGISGLSEYKKNLLVGKSRKNVRNINFGQRSRRVFSNDDFSSSVNDDKYNIKNIVQYSR